MVHILTFFFWLDKTHLQIFPVFVSKTDSNKKKEIKCDFTVIYELYMFLFVIKSWQILTDFILKPRKIFNFDAFWVNRFVGISSRKKKYNFSLHNGFFWFVFKKNTTEANFIIWGTYKSLTMRRKKNWVKALKFEFL